MTKVMTSKQFIDKLKWLVNDVPNVYYSGPNWSKRNSKGQVQFDCVLSVKCILWNFRNDYNINSRGGTIYKSNGVPDFTCNGALNYCTGVSTDFSHLTPGEYLCMKDTKYNHTGVYIGDGKVFECTSSRAWGVSKCIISEINSKGERFYKGKRNLKWTYHGKLNYIDYPEIPITNQVAIWQKKMNEQWNCGLAVDGSFGPACTKEATKHYLHYGIKAPIMVKWLQTRLKELGYSSIAIDGSFGPDTRQKVKSFQKKVGLAVDGNVGPATVKALTE